MRGPGPIALRAVADAVANVGVHEEGGENEGKAVSIYLASVGIDAPAPWCAAFGYYRLQEAAKEVGMAWPQMGYPRSGYCPDIKNWAKEKGLWQPERAARGDIALFYFAAKGRVAHYGLVMEVGEKTFVSVEGNTGPTVGVQREGEGVYVKKHDIAAVGSGGGFVRLPF